VRHPAVDGRAAGGRLGLVVVTARAVRGRLPRRSPRYDLSKDGRLDVAEFRAAVYDIIHQKLKGNPVLDAEVRHALG